MSWERVDVNFSGSAQRFFAHNTIQACITLSCYFTSRTYLQDLNVFFIVSYIPLKWFSFQTEPIFDCISQEVHAYKLEKTNIFKSVRSCRIKIPGV